MINHIYPYNSVYYSVRKMMNKKGNKNQMKTKKVNNKNIGNFLLNSEGKYYENSVKEVITDNGYIIGLEEDGEVLVSQITMCGTMSNNLYDIGYDYEKEFTDEDGEMLFNKLVDKLSIKSNNEFKHSIEWEFIYYSCEEIVMDNIKKIMKEI